jgi:hypothetical protein
MDNISTLNNPNTLGDSRHINIVNYKTMKKLVDDNQICNLHRYWTTKNFINMHKHEVHFDEENLGFHLKTLISKG